MDVAMQSEVISAGTDDHPAASLFNTPERNNTDKKRGRPKKDIEEVAPIQWTDDMIRTVLEQRELLKQSF